MQGILVTGATGCTGAGVLHYLVSKGYKNIYGMTRREPKDKIHNVKYVFGDLTEKSSIQKILKENEIDSIWHIGAAVHTNVKKKDFARVNFEGTKNIIQSAVEFRIKNIIFASTTAVYGKLKDFPVKETHRIKPKGLYSKSKYNAEVLIKLLCEENKINGSIVRIPIIIGKHDRHFFPVVSKLVKINLMPIIGKPFHKVSIVHPYDIGQAFEILNHNGKEKIESYNVVSENPPYKELIDKVEKFVVGKKRIKLYLPYFLVFIVFWVYEILHWIFAYGKQPIINREYARMIGKEWCFDIEKLKHLGYTPRMNLEDIIEDVVSEEIFPIPET
ncbi:NAD(P)-dependent oxidoreductase [Candidatus Heimdallarchaeota archaeon]|nr:MAG: NAD(P)-dependent oxidoreductase [Candidatus Heimdallarchaeota archaeon]